MTIELVVPGEPIPTERARKGRNGWYTPRKTLEFRERIEQAWRDAGSPTLDGPVAVSARFYLRRPPSHFRTGRNSHLLKPAAPAFPACDVDNLLKGLLDGLNERAWEDDRQVVCLAGIHKFYGEPRTELSAWATHPSRLVA